MRSNKRPIAIIRRSCSDSSVTASQTDRVFRSDRRKSAAIRVYDFVVTIL
jgi:hypothetical protein